MIFERWLIAADRLGPLWSRFATYSLDDVSRVLTLCGEGGLADQLAFDGPRVLTGLDMERRSEIAAKVEPTLRPSLKHLLQGEAVAMERRIGTEVPLRIVVFGRALAGPTVDTIMSREFPHQRGTAVSLDRPPPRALAYFEEWRHQLLWPEPARTVEVSKPRVQKVTRVAFGRPRESVPGELWDLRRLARLNPCRHYYSSFAARSYVALEPAELLPYGALTLAGAAGDDRNVDLAVDVLFASGVRTIVGSVPVAFFLSGSESGFGETDAGENRARLFLGNPRESYGRIDFEPRDQSVELSLHRTRDQSSIARIRLELDKHRRIFRRLERHREEITQDLATEIAQDLTGTGRRERARTRARLTVDLVLPMAVRYLEWRERVPEAPILNREELLASLEGAMVQDIPEIFKDLGDGTSADLARRDIYRLFERFLSVWNYRDPTL
ncbi:MAG TPA: hypothetical protein VLJ37_00765 [bacterium]|nr:hypothetical protein [bacterium]